MHRPRIEGRLLMINHDVSFRRRFLLSQLAVQRAARNAERLRRPAEITARPADRRLQRLQAGIGVILARRQHRDGLRQIVQGEHRMIVRQRQQHLERTQQLPHVAGPRVARQHRQRLRQQANVAPLAAQLSPQLQNEGFQLRPLSERRNAQAVFLYAVQQILTKRPRLYLPRQIVVRGADQREIDRISAAAAERRDRFSCNTRSSRVCRPAGMSPISSRNSTPPSASRILPI